MGHPQQIRATTDLEGANMARLSLIVSEDRMSIAQYRVYTLKSHTFRNVSYKDIHIQRRKYTKWVLTGEGVPKTRVTLKFSSYMCSDIHARKCGPDIAKFWKTGCPGLKVPLLSAFKNYSLVYLVLRISIRYMSSLVFFLQLSIPTKKCTCIFSSK